MEPIETESREQLFESREYERRARMAAVADVARLQEREAELLQRLAEYESGLRPTGLSTPGPQVSEPGALEEENQALRRELKRRRAAEERLDVNARVTVPEYWEDEVDQVFRMHMSAAEMRGVLALAALLGEYWGGFSVSFVSSENGDVVKPDGDTARFVRSHVIFEKLRGGGVPPAERLPEASRVILTECEKDVVAVLSDLRCGDSPCEDTLGRLDRRIDFLIDEGNTRIPGVGV